MNPIATLSGEARDGCAQHHNVINGQPASRAGTEGRA